MVTDGQGLKGRVVARNTACLCDLEKVTPLGREKQSFWTAQGLMDRENE